MAAPNLFEQLEEFLPKHISPVPSYLHASLAFAVTGLVSYHIAGKLITSDFTRDGRVTEEEARAKKYVQIGACTLLSLLLADAVFSISFKVRGFRINRKHFTYSKWFPSLYS